MATVEVRLSALPTHVRTARLVATALARKAGVDERVLDEVRLAVGEACSRAVGLHQLHAPDVPVLMLLTEGELHFTVTVQDAGPAGAEVADGEAASLLPDLDSSDRARNADRVDPLPAGFGLAVIAGLVDEIEIRSAAEGADAVPGTSVRMTWVVAVPSQRDGG